jgi:PAS domain S-box-containing protein
MASKKIMLVDDDPDMQNIGRIIIQKAKYDYICASTSEEAFEKLLAEKPDLIILDFMMPQMSGDKFFQELTSNTKYAEFRKTPVIMLTARSEDNIDQDALFEKGLAAFLIKPFGHRELINVIENVIKMSEIRERNLALQEEIERTRYKYRDLIENANDLIFTLDDQGKVIFVNKQLAKLTGLDSKEWLEHFLADLVIPQDKLTVEDAISRCRKGAGQQFQMRARDSNNSTKYFATNLNPLRDSDSITGMVGIARDVTEKYQLELRIADLESFTESIIRSISSGLITIDRNRKITYFNSAAEEILGYSSKDVLDHCIDDIFADDEAKIVLPPENGKGRVILSQEAVITQRDGRKVHIGYSHTPWLDNENSQLGTIITFRDISTTKQIQIEMIRMDRLASLGVLAAGIAHEIRNPLAGIKTIVQTLEEEVEADHSHREYLQRILRQVNRLDELLKAFFSYARPRPPIKKRHQMPDILHEVAILLGKRLSTGKIKFTEHYEKNLKPVYVDLNQILQVFLNLIINALDAMPNGGELTITARNVIANPSLMDRRGKAYKGPRDEASFVEVNITDSGVGIRPEHVESIFDPFFTTKPQGTGLGLSIVYRIVEEHGGEIKVTNDVENKTNFRLLLPMEE